MAKDNSTSKIGRGRKAHPKTGTRRRRIMRAVKHAGSDTAEPSPFEDFGGERTTLMKAEAVLACLSVSLNYYGWSRDDGTTYAMAVDVARGLVQASMDRLEQRDRQIDARKRRPN